MNIFDAEQYQINNDLNSDREPHCAHYKLVTLPLAPLFGNVKCKFVISNIIWGDTSIQLH